MLFEICKLTGKSRHIRGCWQPTADIDRFMKKALQLMHAEYSSRIATEASVLYRESSTSAIPVVTSRPGQRRTSGGTMLLEKGALG
jgi:hypothetical protein